MFYKEAEVVLTLGPFLLDRVWQKWGLLECGWWGDNMGVIIYHFNLNISPKMSYGVLKCDIVKLQNYMLMIL